MAEENRPVVCPNCGKKLGTHRGPIEYTTRCRGCKERVTVKSAAEAQAAA